MRILLGAGTPSGRPVGPTGRPPAFHHPNPRRPAATVVATKPVGVLPRMGNGPSRITIHVGSGPQFPARDWVAAVGVSQHHLFLGP